MRASSGRTAPRGPASSKVPTTASAARSITCSTTARRAPPRPRCKLTYTRSPGIASRIEREPKRYVPSAVSTSARESYTRTVPVSPGNRRDRAGPCRPFFPRFPLPMHSSRPNRADSNQLSCTQTQGCPTNPQPNLRSLHTSPVPGKTRGRHNKDPVRPNVNPTTPNPRHHARSAVRAGDPLGHP